MSKFELPKTILSRDGEEEGAATGTTRHYQLEGCRGLRIGVRWSDGKITWPCSKGMTEQTPGTWKIE